MVFSSLVFLFVFLVIHLAVYALVSEKYHNAVLLVSSLVFYSWGGPQYLFLLVGDTFASWLFALMIERAPSHGMKKLYLVLEFTTFISLYLNGRACTCMFELDFRTHCPSLAEIVA